jgi:beta-glucosidase
MRIDQKDHEEITGSCFGADFLWGVSTAAFQIEGAYDHDGKGLSIWDEFSLKKGRIKNHDHARVSSDFYHNYKQDIDLMKQLGIPNFRFSISWPRLMPTGELPSNQKGIDFYNEVINYCLVCNITPWVTIYHWDLPLAMERQGGWTNRSVIKWFEAYVKLCAEQFGDRVKHWMVMNEPLVFTGAGYFLGIHAPGKRGLKNFLKAVHHATLSIACGGRLLKTLLPEAEIGTTFSCSYVEPATQKRRDVKAAKTIDTLLNRLVLEPILGMGYPVADFPAVKAISKYMLPGDEDLMKFDFDFIGLQNYTRDIVKHSFFRPYVQAKIVPPAKRKVPQTLMKWEIFPAAIYHTLKRYSSYPAIKKIIVTENGAAFPDKVTDGSVNDVHRMDFIKAYLGYVLKAKNEGCPVSGYFIWTLTDNFEWAEGYHPRFGLIYVDFETQQRIIKDSGKWYSNFIKS